LRNFVGTRDCTPPLFLAMPLPYTTAHGKISGTTSL
jgi:hypothetical protein